MAETAKYEGMEDVYSYCMGEVYVKAMKKFRNRAIAEDIASELYVMVEIRRGWFLKAGAVKQTEFLNAREKRIFAQYESIQRTEVFKETMYGEMFNSTDNLLFIEEDDFRSNYQGISEKDKLLVERRVLEGKTIKEIAEESGLKENTVSKRISRAMAKIKNTAAKNHGSI